MKINEIIFSDEITLWWDKERDARDRISYRAVLADASGVLCEKSLPSTHVTFDGLAEEHGYQVSIRREGEKDAFANLTLQTKKAKKRVDVTKAPYFAKADGKTLLTDILQRAFADCTPDVCLYFPAGTYLTGALRLHSHTEIYLDEGAILQGSERACDYLPRIPSRFEGLEMECYSSLLNMGELDHASGANCEDIVIRGKGAILGGGLALCNEMIELERERLKDFLAENEAFVKTCENNDTVPGRVRSRLLNISNCDNVLIAGLTLGYAASWNIHFIYSSNITTYNCLIKSRGVWNGDGWDPDSSVDCLCFGCRFETHDNSIAVKSGKNPEGNQIARPTERVRIFDCHGGQCMALGSEMSGGISDCYIWDCDFTQSSSGFGVKVTPKRGGYVRDCRIRDCAFSSIRMRTVSFNDDGEPSGEMSKVSNLAFENILLTGNSVLPTGEIKPTEPLLVAGLDGEENHFTNVTFKGVRFAQRCDGKEQVLLVKNVRGFLMEDVSFEA